MRPKSLLSIAVYLLVFPLFAQQGITFFDGNRTYDGVTFTFSTEIPENSETVSFSTIENYKSLEVGIVKTPRGGYLVLTMKTDDFPPKYIRGPVIVFLENGQVIKCIDRGNHTIIDNEALSHFNLTKGEMDLLKKYRITSVSFFLSDAYYMEFNTTRHRAENSKNIPTNFWIDLFLN